jgi:hypothetical protein
MRISVENNIKIYRRVGLNRITLLRKFLQVFFNGMITNDQISLLVINQWLQLTTFSLGPGVKPRYCFLPVVN